MLKACRVGGLCFAIAVSLFGICCFAQETAAPIAAPPNPEFVQYLRSAAAGRWPTASEDGYPLGLIPSPVDLSHTAGMVVRPIGSPDSLPSAYDMRSETPCRLPAIREEGGCGCCWTFASYGSLESCLLPSQSLDLSENHLKNTHGFDWTCCEGGNHLMTTAYLSRWSGPVLESSDPYDPDSCSSPSGVSPVFHVQSVDFIPDRQDSLDNASIKQAVMSSGAVYTGLYWSGASYNSTTRAYYCGTTQCENHAVCIVGWDDNYPSTSFTPSAPGDGAFIARNSWGSDWGENGYFYVSYYDGTVGRDNTIFNNAEPTTNYDRVYQYDPYGWVGSTGFASETAWLANIFTSTALGELKAVSFYTASPNSTYEIGVYINPSSGPLNPSGPICTQTGVLAPYGYHTIQLESPVQLSAAQKFSVVIKLTTPGYRTPIAYEYPMSDYCSYADSNTGESYISANGVTWLDIHNYYTRSNVCIKAFVNDYEMTVTPAAGLDSEGLFGGPFAPTGKNYALKNISSSSIEWSALSDVDWLAISPDGGSIDPGGTVDVTVSINSTAQNLPVGFYTGSVDFSVSGGHCDGLRQVSLVVMSDYSIAQVPCQWIDPASHAVLPLSDDGVSPAQDIPFEFRFYEKSYAKLYIAANGMVGFSSSGMSKSSNTDLPDTALPNAVLYPYWDDLDPELGGSIRIGTVGTAPNRRLAVSWIQVPIKVNPASTVTFQVILCEGSNDIFYQYSEVAQSDSTYGAGRGATVGLENDKGTLASRYSYNGSVTLGEKMAIRFNDRGPEIPYIKKRADGFQVSLSRKIVTAAFPETFYIESDDRLGGIAVRKTGHGMLPGMRASVAGVIKAAAEAERYIDASYVRQDGYGSVDPLLMTTCAMGGSDWGWRSGDPGGQRGAAFGYGLNNIGLLVKLCGCVQSPYEGGFYLNNGAARDPSAVALVACPSGVDAPIEGSVVGVTGISSLDDSDGAAYRLLRVRSTSDIIVYAAP